MLDHYCTDLYFVGMKVATGYGSMLYYYCLHRFMLHKFYLHKFRVILVLFALTLNLHNFLLILAMVGLALVALASSYITSGCINFWLD